MNSFGLSSGNTNYDAGTMAQLQSINSDLNSLKTQMQMSSGQPKSSAKIPTISGLLGTELQYNDNADEAEDNEFKLIYGRIAVKGDIADNIGYQVQADFSRTANDMLLDAYVHLNPTFNTILTIGQFYTNYSTVNTRSSTKQRFISKPVANARISPPTRDIGATLGFSQNDYSVTVGVFNGAGQNQADANKYKNLAGRITYKLLPALAVSGNAYYGKSNEVDSLAEDISMYNGGAQIAFNRITIEGEYSYGKTDQLEKTGYFVDIWYEHKGPGIISSIAPGARFDWYDPNNDQEDDIQMRYTGGIKFTFAKLPNMSVLANYEYYDTENTDGNDKRFLVDMQLSF
jgi:hypothetical protein